MKFELVGVSVGQCWSESEVKHRSRGDHVQVFLPVQLDAILQSRLHDRVLVVYDMMCLCVSTSVSKGREVGD